MENKFNNQNELFNKVKPALRTKKNELVRNGIKFVNELDIWEYNKIHNWRKAKGLTLASIVNDILNTDDKLYEEFVLKKFERREDNE
ncbi:MAG: hypothetical protein J1F35_01245 [Erysipelotrichales bacterium]|nr:hypothetical protein [Erysipelotrichales bacterium]